MPDSTLCNMGGAGQQSDQKDYSATILAMLSGEKIHSLDNVMTLQRDIRDFFGRLDIWFEATSTPHHYIVKTTNSLFLLPTSTMFTTTDSTNLPLPSPRLLALHAAAAKVAHLSGAGDRFWKILRALVC